MTLLVFRNMGRFRNMPNSELGYMHSVIFIVGLILDIVCSASSLRQCICDCLYVCPYMSMSLSVCRYLSLYVSGCLWLCLYTAQCPLSLFLFVYVCLCFSIYVCLPVSASVS